MATVVDQSEVGTIGLATDRNYSAVSRSNAGTPRAALTPAFVGEIVNDTTNNQLYRAVGSTNIDWAMIDAL